MPSRNEIFKEIENAFDFAADNIRRKYLKDLSAYSGNDTIMISSGFSSDPRIPQILTSIGDDDVHGIISALQGLSGDTLDLVIHSLGGTLEATIQIVKCLRNEYVQIRAIIPQNAMSTATMIACACDYIMMGEQSAIGPIDPQISVAGPKESYLVSAWSVINELKQAKLDAKNDPSLAEIWSRRLERYPPGLLTKCEESIVFSREKLEEWLSSWMLKGKKGAKKIAEWLTDHDQHKIMTRPIDRAEARAYGLAVEALESDKIFLEKLNSVYYAAVATHYYTRCVKFVENQNGIGYYLNLEVTPQSEAEPVVAKEPAKPKRISKSRKRRR